ncbi:hypothetical protein ACI8AC_07455 [Geodermatophilus sp. SYSU D00758]
MAWPAAGNGSMNVALAALRSGPPTRWLPIGCGRSVGVAAVAVGDVEDGPAVWRGWVVEGDDRPLMPGA